MAVTAFWPVKGDLKPVIDYAENPDKTTPTKYLDKDLAAVLQYAEDAEKTDRKMLVTGINCEGETAYEENDGRETALRQAGRQCGLSRLSAL